MDERIISYIIVNMRKASSKCMRHVCSLRSFCLFIRCEHFHSIFCKWHKTACIIFALSMSINVCLHMENLWKLFLLTTACDKVDGWWWSWTKQYKITMIYKIDARKMQKYYCTVCIYTLNREYSWLNFSQLLLLLFYGSNEKEKLPKLTVWYR